MEGYAEARNAQRATVRRRLDTNRYRGEACFDVVRSTDAWTRWIERVGRAGYAAYLFACEFTGARVPFVLGADHGRHPSSTLTPRIADSR